MAFHPDLPRERHVERPDVCRARVFQRLVLDCDGDGAVIAGASDPHEAGAIFGMILWVRVNLDPRTADQEELAHAGGGRLDMRKCVSV